MKDAGQNKSSGSLIRRRNGDMKLDCSSVRNKSGEPTKYDAVISLSISDRHRSLSIDLDEEQITDIVTACNVVIQNSSLEFEDALPFLTAHLSRDEERVCEFAHNYIGNNTVQVIDSFFRELDSYRLNPNSFSTADWELMDDMDRCIFQNATIVCRFKRQLDQVLNDIHKCKEPLLVSVQDSETSDKTTTGIYWHQQTLTITYQPRTDKRETVVHPWMLKIEEKRVDRYGDIKAPPNGRAVKEIKIRLSDKDFCTVVNRISTMSFASE